RFPLRRPLLLVLSCCRRGTVFWPKTSGFCRQLWPAWLRKRRRGQTGLRACLGICSSLVLLCLIWFHARAFLFLVHRSWVCSQELFFDHVKVKIARRWLGELRDD